MNAVCGVNYQPCLSGTVRTLCKVLLLVSRIYIMSSCALKLQKREPVRAYDLVSYNKFIKIPENDKDIIASLVYDVKG